MNTNMSAEVPISQVSRNIKMTVTVTGMRVWNLRMQLTLMLLKLAAWVAPIDANVEVNP